MAKRGPKPKPTALLIASGSRKLGGRANEPQIETLHDIPACPAWLQGHAREFWEQHAQRLVTSGIITDLDLPSFASLCRQWQMWREAEAQLKSAEDSLQICETGYQQVSGWETLAAKRYAAFCKTAVEFGMTPSARSRVNAVPRKSGEVVDKRAAFYDRKAK